MVWAILLKYQTLVPTKKIVSLIDILIQLICSVEMDEPPLVKTAAQLFRRYCYKYRDSRTAGIICAGWDKREAGQV